MKEVRFVLGLPGAGKSTYCKERFEGRSDVDLFEVDTIRKAWNGNSFDPATEIDILQYLIEQLSDHWYHKTFRLFVIDEAFTCPWPIMALTAIFKREGFKCYAVVIERDPGECWNERIASGFPSDELHRKFVEWDANKDLILTYFDGVEYVDSRQGMLDI